MNDNDEKGFENTKGDNKQIEHAFWREYPTSEIGWNIGVLVL